MSNFEDVVGSVEDVLLAKVHGYRPGDRVRLVKKYGGLDFNPDFHSDQADTWVYPGDEGKVIGLNKHYIEVKFPQSPVSLLCTVTEIEKILDEGS